MDRVLAFSVLLLVPAPHLCRRLSIDNLDNISHNGLPLESVERYGLLPTPNIATPFLTPPLIATDQPSLPPHIYSQEHEIELLSAVHKSASNPVRLRKQYHKIPITKIYNDEGKRWTKFPNNKNLVEIVPLRHKTKKSKGKGKALAYILSKPKIVKKTLDNEHDYLTESSESNEENFSYSDSFDKDSSESHSIESNSLEYNEPKPHHKSTHPHKHSSELKRDTEYSKDMVNNKISDLVEYLKDHSNGTVDKLIHDVVPDVEDPNLHVHYIIHKKKSPHKHSHGLTDNDLYTQQVIRTYPTYESPITGENIRHNVPENNVISRITSDEHNINYGHNTHVANNHLHPHHHKTIHSLENTDSLNIHYIVENTDHGPILFPNVIHEDVKSFPEIIFHPTRLPDAHDIHHTIAESNIIPEYTSYIPENKILEPGHNNYILSHHPEVNSHSHSLVNHINPDIEENSIDSYLVEAKDPEDIKNERLIKSNEVYQSPIHIYLEDINEGYIKDPSNSLSDSSKIDSIEDSASSSNYESSEDKVSNYPATIDLKQIESADNSMSSFSDSSSTSDELENNTNSFEESTAIEDTIPTMIPTLEELLSVFPSNIDDTFETSSSSQEESVKHVIPILGNENEIHVSAMDGQDKTHDCNKLNRTRNSNNHKIYKLTFMFNR